METSLKPGFAQIFSCCLKNPSCPKFGGAAAPGRGGSHTLPIRVCAAQSGRDFEAHDLERGIHFRGVF